MPFIRAPRLTRNAEFPLPPFGRSSRRRGRYASASRPSRARCCRPSGSLAVPPELVGLRPPSMSAVRPLRGRPADHVFLLSPKFMFHLVLYWCCIGVVLVLVWGSVGRAIARAIYPRCRFFLPIFLSVSKIFVPLHRNSHSYQPKFITPWEKLRILFKSIGRTTLAVS